MTVREVSKSFATAAAAQLVAVVLILAIVAMWGAILS